MQTTKGFPDPFKASKDAFVENYFREALRETKGCISSVAEAAGLHRSVVHYHIDRLGIDADEYRRDPVREHRRVARIAAAPGRVR